MYVDPGEGAGQPLGMTGSPDKLVRLMEGIDAERERLQTWLFHNGMQLVDMAAPGTDPCSRDSVAVFSQNGESAIGKANAYVTSLANTVEELRACARDYGLIDAENTDNFRRETE